MLVSENTVFINNKKKKIDTLYLRRSILSVQNITAIDMTVTEWTVHAWISMFRSRVMIQIYDTSSPPFNLSCIYIIKYVKIYILILNYNNYFKNKILILNFKQEKIL